MIRKIFLSLDEKDFKKLSNMKEEWKILGKCTCWEDFILNLAKLESYKEVERAK